MIGVVLAGGSGSRLMPLTKSVNKHLVRVGNKPMIYHPIEMLRDAGITEIVVVTGVEHIGQIADQLGDGSDLGVSVTYRVQAVAGGIAQALKIVQPVVRKEDMVVVLGDNIFVDFNLKKSIEKFTEFNKYCPGPNCKLFLKQVHDPERFGVAEIGGPDDFVGKQIISIEEKPSNPKTNLAVTGLYMYDNCVFDFINRIGPSARGELEITDVNNLYIQNGVAGYDLIEGFWSDAGTFPSLATVENYLMSCKEENLR